MEVIVSVGVSALIFHVRGRKCQDVGPRDGNVRPRMCLLSVVYLFLYIHLYIYTYIEVNI